MERNDLGIAGTFIKLSEYVYYNNNTFYEVMSNLTGVYCQSGSIDSEMPPPDSLSQYCAYAGLGNVNMYKTNRYVDN